VYRTRDGAYVAVSGTTDPQVSRLLALLDRDGPEDRARFGAAAARLAHADELDALVAAYVAGRDLDDVVTAFLGARIPVAPVNDVAAILADPHLAARGSLAPMLEARGPDLDGDHAAILREWLG
jgi:crotonobetainyl-CoA:carnitine CoA-transferase CaiB-like acyl-CoA transferase